MGNDSSKSKPGGSTSSKASNVLASLKPGPSTAVIQRHLDTAKKSRSLTLKGMNLKAIPRELGEVSFLLIIFYNKTIFLGCSTFTKFRSFTKSYYTITIILWSI
jgi:hypothetical protein